MAILATFNEKITRPGDDPIRMYLSQMAEIPLLTREQEIGLAKRIEIARKRFRRSVLSCDYSLRQTVATLKTGLCRRFAVRPHDQGLVDRTSDQGTDLGPHAPSFPDDRSPAGRKPERFPGMTSLSAVGRGTAGGADPLHSPPSQTAATGRGTQFAFPSRRSADRANEKICRTEWNGSSTRLDEVTP